MAIKKFNDWYNELNEDGISSLGQVGAYGVRSAEAGLKKSYGLKDIRTALNIFLSQFNQQHEQKELIRILKLLLMKPSTMFNSGNQMPVGNQQANAGNQMPVGNQQANTGN